MRVSVETASLRFLGISCGWMVCWFVSLGTVFAAEPVADSYADAIRRTPGLLLYYRFEEESELITDLAQPPHPGRKQGTGIATVPSAFPTLGQGLQLNKGDHIDVPELGEVEAVSIETWIKLKAAPAEGITGLYAGDQWSPGFLHFNLKAPGSIEWAINGSGRYLTSEPETLPFGRWVHLVVTSDSSSGTQRLYRDGRLLAEEQAEPHPVLKLVAGKIGSWFNGQLVRPLEAELDEFAIYSVVLAPSQVRQHFQLARGIIPQPVDFVKEVRPLLEQRCLGCHGEDLQEGGLRLDIRDWVLQGGESGEPALSPWDSTGSHLLQLVKSTDTEQRMPADGPPLTETEIELLTNWIELGAPWPDELAGKMERDVVSTKHWSFQPLKRVPPPASDAPFVVSGNEIDAFVHAQLLEHVLTPSQPADRRTLIRRLYLDLHGLPPTPEEVASFVTDSDPQAWERLVDRALASPRYGERWASHWLDVIRYGDTHGFEVNTPRDRAWPYRDYVIASLNADKPYNVFLREQIAGDQVGVDAATGFLVAAPALLSGQVGRDVASMRLARQDELHEVIVSVGSGVLGLTVGCARCHNHKFDPVSQRDYYQLQAIFSGLRYGERGNQAGQVKLREDLELPEAVFAGNFSTPSATHRLYRGDPMQRRERVSPDIPAVFGSLQLSTMGPEAERRLALADWLARDENPLTCRVLVNRVWQHHFGTGLVRTPSDFGGMGVPPTHPELLDWLAVTFQQEGWSLKQLHRRILLSNTYQQANRPRPEALAKDANNTWLWRFQPRRLEMEPIRDSMLAVSGALDLTMGGPGFLVFKPNSNYVRIYDPKEEWEPSDFRRMIYAHRVRMAQDGVFGAFDCPDAGQPAPLRSRSTTAIQALNLLNSSFVGQQSEILAQRVEKEAGTEPDAQLRRLFQRVLGRDPKGTELAAAQETAREFGLPTVCRALLNSSEFLFLP